MLVVCDRANARLQTFDLDGKPIAATESRQGGALPGARQDPRRRAAACPTCTPASACSTRTNKPIVHLGDDAAWRKKVVDSLGKGMPPIRTQPKEWPAGKFVHPHDAAFDKDGNIFVVEWVQHRPRHVPEEGGVTPGERLREQAAPSDRETRPADAWPFAPLRLDGQHLRPKE